MSRLGVWLGRLVALFGALGLSLVSSPTAAQDARAVDLTTHIEVAIREACPTAVAVQARLDVYLAQSDPEPLSATLRVSEAEGQFRVQLGLTRGPSASERAVWSASCAGALEAALLIVAITADPSIGARSSPEEGALVEPPDAEEGDAGAELPAEEGAPLAHDEPAEDEVPPSEAPSTPEASGAPADPGPVVREVRGVPRDAEPSEDGPVDVWFMARAGPLLSIGVVPEPSVGALAELGVRLEFLEIGIGARWASETAREVRANRGGSFALYEGTLRVGGAFAFEWFELVASLRFGAGAMTGRGYGVSRPLSATTPFFDLAGVLEARVRWRLEPGLDLAVFLSGDVQGALVQPQFVIVGGESVYTPSDVAGSIALGLRVLAR